MYNKQQSNQPSQSFTRHQSPVNMNMFGQALSNMRNIELQDKDIAFKQEQYEYKKTQDALNNRLRVKELKAKTIGDAINRVLRFKGIQVGAEDHRRRKHELKVKDFNDGTILTDPGEYIPWTIEEEIDDFSKGFESFEKGMKRWGAFYERR